MTGIFGGPSPGEQKPGQEDVLGVNSQPTAPEDSGQGPGQPEEGQALEQQQEPIPPGEAQDGSQGQPEDIEQQQTQQQRILGKFDNHEQVADSLENIGKKLGKQVDWQKLVNEQGYIEPQKLEEAYRQAEQELGKTSDVDKARWQLNAIRQENEQMKQYMNQLQQAYQQQIQQIQQQMQRGPQEQQQGQPQQQEEPNVDAWLDRLYRDGPKAVDELVQKRLQEIQNQEQQPQTKEASEEQQDPVKQVQQQWEQKQKVQKMQNFYASQVNELQQKYGQDFENLRQKTAEIVRNNKYYAYMPNGFERAYLRAKRESGAKPAQPQQVSQQQQQNNVLKNAARMPGTTGRMPQQQMSQEDMVRQQIFGGQTKKGVFG